MKVLQVVPCLGAGGAEGFITNLGVELFSLGVDVRMYTLAGARGVRGQALLERLKRVGVKVTGADPRSPRSPKNLLELISIIQGWKPDVIQGNLFPAEVACAVAKNLVMHRKAVYVRRLANTDLCAYRSKSVVKNLDWFFDATIACSPAVADAFGRFMKYTHRSQVVTIPNGGLLRNTIVSDFERQGARQDLQIASTSFVVAHVGRMTPGKTLSGSLADSQKGHDVLLKAFARAFAHHNGAVLLSVGDGPLRAEAESLACELGIRTQTRFLGELSEPWPVLAAADLFCFPSRYEGLPNVLPEAASCGLPVVASDIPEIRALSPGDSWVLAPVDDIESFALALTRVRSRFEEYSQMAQEAAPVIRERFSMETCALKYLDAYQSCLSGKVRRNG